MEEQIYMVLKDEEGILRPIAGIWLGGKFLEYSKPDIDKFLSRKGMENYKVVKVKLVEVN